MSIMEPSLKARMDPWRPPTTTVKFINIHHHHDHHHQNVHRKEYSIYIINCLLLIFLQFSCLILPIADSYANKHIERYSHPDIQHYKTLLFDVLRFELYIGARDHILILNLNDFGNSLKRDHYLPPTTEKTQKCHIKGMKKEECHNFITTLLPIQSSSTNYKDKQILVCGTNAYSPECEIRRLSDSFDSISKSITINAFSPHWNTVSLISSTGDFFYGGQLDLRGVDAAIIKQTKIFAPKSSQTPQRLFNRIVRTAQYDPKWMSSDANFVFSFEYNDFVYFLFRETAVEFMNIGKRVYSRVGRVCKDDIGSRDIWTTFLKTRINCSLPGNMPFYFDEIQSVDLVDNGGTPTLYAIFNTPQNSIHGSAVCAFTMDSITEAFRGPFKHQKSSGHIWERIKDDHKVFECKMTNMTESKDSHVIVRRNQQMYQQIDDAVQPIAGRPFIIAKHEYFRFIAVDIIKTKYYDQVEIQFIATTDGRLLKYVRWPFMNESCLVDDVTLIDPNENRFLSMKFLIDTQSLYIGTEKEIIRLSVHQCHNYPTRQQCIQSGDPYCGWSETKMKCMKAPGNNLKDDTWIQSDQPMCLSRWSKWFTCSDATKPSDIICKCRKRQCTSNSVDRCYDGYEFEVSNCTQNNGWSEWSPWSQCTPSCGKGSQYRTRECNSAFPGNDRQCLGNDREERLCDNLPYCTWSPWSEWTNCSDCTSNKKRTRHCLDFSGNPVNTEYCPGPYIETEKCDCQPRFEWSKWSITDLNPNEVVEQRTEMVMRPNNVPPKQEQRLVSLKYCDQCGGHLYNFKGKSLLIKECSCNDEMIWSDWSEWSSCFNDIQTRERKCLINVDQRQCDGHFKEIRYCQFMSSQNPRVQPIPMKTANWRLLLAAFLLIILSSGLTAIILLLYFYRKNKLNPDLMINHTISSEPNTYEEPEKCRILTPMHNGINTSTLTRISTLKKNPSFRAKLDDSNY